MALVGTASAVGMALGGGGPQPDDVLPASSVAVLEVDLDPSVSQKVAIFRLARHFPTTKDRVSDQGKVRDQLLSSLFGQGSGLDYDRDVAPWIGDRAGIAVVPHDGTLAPVAAVAFRDRDAARRGLEKARASDDTVVWAFSSQADYVLIGDDRATIDEAARGDRVLSDDGGYARSVKQLDGDQVVTGWVDIARLYAALPEDARRTAAQAYGDGKTKVDPRGTIVLGAHASADSVELVAKTLDLSGLPVDAMPSRGTGLAGDLPADAVAALSMTGLGDTLAKALPHGADDPFGLDELSRQSGVSFARDLPALLGRESAGALLPGPDDTPALVLRTRNDDVGKAYDVASRLSSEATGAGTLRRLDDGLVYASDAGALGKATGDGPRLRDLPSFRRAVPDANDAAQVGYVDVGKALRLSGSTPTPDQAPLEAVGYSTSGDLSHLTLRVRLTLRG